MADFVALEGVAELTRKLKALYELDNGRILRAAVRAGIQPALEAAQSTIPIGTREHRTYTGRLVAPGFASRHLNVVITTSRDKQMAAALLGPSKEAYYATQFVELGTSKMAAQPWLRPAFYSTRSAQQAALANELREALIRIVKRK